MVIVIWCAIFSQPGGIPSRSMRISCDSASRTTAEYSITWVDSMSIFNMLYIVLTKATGFEILYTGDNNDLDF